MSSRFGRENLGFAWLFLEPALLGGTIGLGTTSPATACPGG
jgi:capsular polysaccharide transport system permease protein